MKNGLAINYNPNYDREPKFWVTVWKYGRIVRHKSIRYAWIEDEMTNFPFPTKSSITRCLALLQKLNEKEI